MGEGESVLIAQRIQKSKAKLKAAKHSLSNEDYDDAISRAYYSVFHSSKALLQYIGIEVKTHHALKQMFGIHLVQSGLVDKEMGRCLNELKDERENGDYDIVTYFDKEDAQNAVNKAENFIKKTIVFLKGKGIIIESFDLISTLPPR